ncbi:MULTISPECIES: 1,6-anhydro-N-acetylmuramyl-L-alanine amidase AmpD [Methylococcus]|uniref:1,6-anhydro-N-acetylmuramyl-L-alanine amidase AmpD n=1 Tax=Methylococcus capsulatus TaxID=414 RepID=A0ABZ2F9Y7_METCP|nr:MULTISPECIES: 1,6-anhydro-N-acetylmuramyl-L-alanine amidase AmpD [Methylococcus]MDF9393269.1 1,6-anhydro-N-acetylmuramyl-L-alanine amidase AmpD [Methylococcus capsulatus]
MNGNKEAGCGEETVSSPNQDERPWGETISLIVIHGISLPPGQFGGPWIRHLFANTLDGAVHPFFESIRHLRVSAHALIRRGGEVEHYVPPDRRAWHAGMSEFRGRSACNDFSIGIELEGTDDVPYMPEQYKSLAGLVTEWMARYPAITEDRIVGHCAIAPQRKTDPGPAFDWGCFYRELAKLREPRMAADGEASRAREVTLSRDPPSCARGSAGK